MTLRELQHGLTQVILDQVAYDLLLNVSQSCARDGLSLNQQTIHELRALDPTQLSRFKGTNRDLRSFRIKGNFRITHSHLGGSIDSLLERFQSEAVVPSTVGDSDFLVFRDFLLDCQARHEIDLDLGLLQDALAFDLAIYLLMRRDRLPWTGGAVKSDSILRISSNVSILELNYPLHYVMNPSLPQAAKRNYVALKWEPGASETALFVLPQRQFRLLELCNDAKPISDLSQRMGLSMSEVLKMATELVSLKMATVTR